MTRSFIFRTSLCSALIFMIIFSSGCSQTAKAETTAVFSDRTGCNLSGIQYFPDWYAKYSSKIYVFDEDTYKPSVWLDINRLFKITANENGTPSLTLSNFIIYENKLFLFVKDIKAKSAAIYRCDLDGKNISQLATVENVYSILNIAGIENKLYFTTVLDEGKNYPIEHPTIYNVTSGGSSILCLDLDGNKLSYLANQEQDYNICAQIMDFDEQLIYCREDIAVTNPLFDRVQYASICPALSSWYGNNIDHTNLFTYRLSDGKITQTNENIYLYSSLAYNNNLYNIEYDFISNKMQKIKKLNLKTNESKTILITDKFPEIYPYGLGDNMVVDIMDLHNYNSDGTSNYTDYLLNPADDTLTELKLKDKTIKHIFTLAKLKNGYIIKIFYSNSDQYGYVKKEDLNDFETKMVPFNLE